MSNINTFSFQYDRKAYLQIIFRQYYSGLFIRLVSAGGIISGLLSLLYLTGFNPLSFHSFPFMGLLYGLLTLLVPVLLWGRARQALLHSAIFDQPVTGVLSGDTLTLTSGQLQRKLDRKDIIKKEINGKDLLLFTARESFLHIPGNQLSDEQFQTLSNWLQKA